MIIIVIIIQMENMYKQKSVNSPVAEDVLQQSGGDM